MRPVFIPDGFNVLDGFNVSSIKTDITPMTGNFSFDPNGDYWREKTRTGATSIPEWLLDFVLSPHARKISVLILYRVRCDVKILDQLNLRMLYPSRCWSERSFFAYTIPLLDFVSHLRSSTGVNSRRYESLRYYIFRWHHVNGERRAITGNRGELAPERKWSPGIVKYSLNFCYAWQGQ